MLPKFLEYWLITYGISYGISKFPYLQLSNGKALVHEARKQDPISVTFH